MKPRKEDFVRRYGPWALVTGASDGIGRAFAHSLAARGVKLVLVARRGALLETLAAELTLEHGIDCRVLAADLARLDEVRRVHEATAGLDIGLIVAAAGFGTSGELADASLDDELS